MFQNTKIFIFILFIIPLFCFLFAQKIQADTYKKAKCDLDHNVKSEHCTDHCSGDHEYSETHLDNGYFLCIERYANDNRQSSGYVWCPTDNDYDVNRCGGASATECTKDSALFGNAALKLNKSKCDFKS